MDVEPENEDRSRMHAIMDMELALGLVSEDLSKGIGRVRIDAETRSLMEAALDAEGDDRQVLTKAFCAAFWLNKSSRMPRHAHYALHLANEKFSFGRGDAEAGLSPTAPKPTM